MLLFAFCLFPLEMPSWHSFRKVLQTFLKYITPHWHHDITKFLQMCYLNICDVTLPFHHIPEVLGSGDCGGIKSLPYARNPFEMIWQIALSCWKQDSATGTGVVSNSTRVNNAQLISPWKHPPHCYPFLLFMPNLDPTSCISRLIRTGKASSLFCCLNLVIIEF